MSGYVSKIDEVESTYCFFKHGIGIACKKSDIHGAFVPMGRAYICIKNGKISLRKEVSGIGTHPASLSGFKHVFWCWIRRSFHV